MVHASIIPSHSIAVWLLSHIENILNTIGLRKHETIEQIIYFTIIVAVSFFIGWILRRIILFVTQRTVRLRDSKAGRELLQEHTFTKCSHIIPPLVFLSLAPFAFESTSPIHTIIMRATVAYLCVTIAIALTSVIRFVFYRFNDKQNTKNLPIRGILNIANGIIWLVMIIIAVSVIVHKSPAALLGGMTAFAAVVMLVFKDTILGFVAGMQMTNNDMLRVGDWIVVPSTLANGIVTDVTLTTVKVQNFDNTIVMVPPYTLVSTSFQNWRGMTDSGVRRIAESIYINPDTVVAPSDEMVAAITAKYPAMQKFVDGLKKNDKTVAWEAGNAPLNGTTETNLGLFRAYLVQYLLASAMVDHTKDLFVTIDKLSHEGIALQIYCFSVTTQWEQYEGVTSAILEHAMLTASDFDLEILSADHLNVDTKG